MAVHPPPGIQCDNATKKHVLVPQKWANKSPLTLHVEENPTGFGRKVSQCRRRQFWGPPVGTGTGQWVTGECSEESPVPHRQFHWGLGAAWLAGLGSPTNPPLAQGHFCLPLWALAGHGGDGVHPKPQLPPLPAAPAIADVLEITLLGPCPPLPRPQHPIKTPREPELCPAQPRKAP